MHIYIYTLRACCEAPRDISIRWRWRDQPAGGDTTRSGGFNGQTTMLPPLPSTRMGKTPALQLASQGGEKSRRRRKGPRPTVDYYRQAYGLSLA